MVLLTNSMDARSRHPHNVAHAAARLTDLVCADNVFARGGVARRSRRHVQNVTSRCHGQAPQCEGVEAVVEVEPPRLPNPVWQSTDSGFPGHGVSGRPHHQ